jgi:ribose transport system substrate-binding protein
MRQSPLRRLGIVVAITAASVVLAACSSSPDPGSSTKSSDSTKPIKVAFLSFAVTNNTYDKPMQDALMKAAAENNVEVTVFDANNDPNAQLTQLQSVTNQDFDGIITQPIYGPQLIDAVKAAIATGKKVVNIDQILGTDFTTNDVQVEGLSANVGQNPTDLGRKMGEQTVAACASKKLDPCQVAYMFDIKASSLDVAIRKAFDTAVKDSPVKVIAEGESFFNPANGKTVAAAWLTANPGLDVIVASDQGLEGTDQALADAGKTGGKDVLEVGFGGSQYAVDAVQKGTWFADVAEAPATEGRLGLLAIVDAIRNGKDQGAIDALAKLPNDGVITKSSAKEFSPEWPG